MEALPEVLFKIRKGVRCQFLMSKFNIKEKCCHYIQQLIFGSKNFLILMNINETDKLFSEILFFFNIFINFLATFQYVSSIQMNSKYQFQWKCSYSLDSVEFENICITYGTILKIIFPHFQV